MIILPNQIDQPEIKYGDTLDDFQSIFCFLFLLLLLGLQNDSFGIWGISGQITSRAKCLLAASAKTFSLSDQDWLEKNSKGRRVDDSIGNTFPPPSSHSTHAHVWKWKYVSEKIPVVKIKTSFL